MSETTSPATLPGVHCEACGTPDPVTIDGYTECCNEPTCWGDPHTIWAVGHMGDPSRPLDGRVQTGTILACCGAAAERAVQPAGLSVLHLEGYR
jgi:hypothetical protein